MVTRSSGYFITIIYSQHRFYVTYSYTFVTDNNWNRNSSKEETAGGT